MNSLHGTLAERPCSDNGRSLIIAKRSGDNLGCARRSLVHKHDQWYVEELEIALDDRFGGSLGAIGIEIFIERWTALSRDEAADHFLGARDPSSSVVAEIEHDSSCAFVDSLL